VSKVEVRRCAQHLREILLGDADGVRDGAPFCQFRRNRRREGAAGAVVAFGLQPRRTEFPKRFAVVQ
jgi:hypothetical protein